MWESDVQNLWTATDSCNKNWRILFCNYDHKLLLYLSKGNWKGGGVVIAVVKSEDGGGGRRAGVLADWSVTTSSTVWNGFLLSLVLLILGKVRSRY